MKNLHLHQLLKRCREEANISQEELADKMFVDRSYISKVENGRVPTLSYDFVKRWGIATNRSELIGIDVVGDSSEVWKRNAVYKMAFMQIKSGIDMLEISI
jgi:transcriptional regulator with XRE-family HTH domain